MHVETDLFRGRLCKIASIFNVIAEDVGKIFTTPVNDILAISIIP